MTRKDFMNYAETQIDPAFMKLKTTVFNLLDKAYAEGIRDADTEAVVQIVKDALTKTSKDSE